MIMPASSRATRGAAKRSSSFRRTPLTASPSRYSACASAMCTSASPESYSYMPASKMPTTSNCLTRGSTAAGVTRPCGAIRVTLSPVRTFSARARSRPSRMPKRPACSASKLPDCMWRAKSATLSSSAGMIPRTIVPRTVWSKDSIPCSCT